MKPRSERSTASVWSSRVTPVLAIALPLGALAQIMLRIGPTGIAMTLSDLVVLAALPVVMFAIWRSGTLPVKSLMPGLWPWIALATAALSGGLAIGYSRFGFQGWATMRLVGWGVVVAHLVVAAFIASEPAARRLAVRMFAIGAAAVVLIDVTKILIRTVLVAPENCGWVEPAFGLTPNPNAYAFMLLMGLAVSLGTVRQDYFGTPAVNVLLFAALAFALTLTSSRSAWLAAVVLITFALLAGWTRRLPLVTGLAIGIGLAGLLLIALVCSSSTAVTDDVRAIGRIVTAPAEIDAPMAERLYSHRRALEMFLQYPLFGAGLGAFLAGELNRGSWALIIHSTPLWLLGETGLAGAGAFAALAVAVIVALVRQIKRGTPEDQLDARTALLVLLAFGVMSQAQELLYQRSLWIMLGLFLFSARSATSSWPESKVETGRLSGHPAAGG